MPKDLYNNNRKELGIRTMEHETGEEFGKEKKHVAAVMLGGLLLAGAVIFFAHRFFAGSPSVPVARGQGQPAETVVVSAVSPAVQVREPKVLRDPFAAPGEGRANGAAAAAENPAIRGAVSPPGGAVDETGKPMTAGLKGVSAGRPVLPVLQGIAGSSGQWAAVLQIGVESRSYRLGERAGPYEVMAITRDSVTLSGPDGTTVLAMER